MRFTVLIATRNRPALVRVAIESVLRQSSSDWDMVLINDGSDSQYDAALQDLDLMLGGRCRRMNLVQRMQGHGQSYALNAGAAVAKGDYLCFLDDDDEWTDNDHLTRIAQIIDAQAEPPNLLLSNQAAYRDGVAVSSMIWIEDLLDRAIRPMSPGPAGGYAVTPFDLLQCTGFAHVNATIIRAAHFAQMAGFDETIRYECDRDFFLRAIDSAGSILYLPDVVSRHNIPNAQAKTSMSTMLTNLEKFLFQIRVLDKAILYSRHAAIQQHARQHKVHVLKKLTTALAGAGRYDLALFFGLETALIGFNLRWAGYAILLRLRLMLQKVRKS